MRQCPCLEKQVCSLERLHSLLVWVYLTLMHVPYNCDNI